LKKYRTPSISPTKCFFNPSVKLRFQERIWDIKDLELQRGSNVREFNNQNVIKLSFKKFFQFKSEVKLGFQERICATKDLEFWRGSKIGLLKRQNVIELSIKKFFSFNVKLSF
jgi:hypothetical protein